MPIIQSLITNGKKAVCCVHSTVHVPLAKRMRGLQQVMIAKDLNEQRLKRNDVVVNLRTHPLQKNYWWFSREFAMLYPDYRINDILLHMCSDFGLNPNLDAYLPLLYEPKVELSGKIVLLPGTEVPAKLWPIKHWIQLASIISLKGGQPIIIGQPERCPAIRELLANGIPWQSSPSLSDAVDLLSSAMAVVAVDTGLMHLAVHQRIPTIAMYRRSPLYLRPAFHVFPVTSEMPCLEACYQAEMKAAGKDLPGDHLERRMGGWDCADPTAGCMSAISPNDVMHALAKALKFTGREFS
ncbi:hypothetical protein K8T06_13500 [bacterium]|nr:hypothetical protein [bacterium]